MVSLIPQSLQVPTAFAGTSTFWICLSGSWFFIRWKPIKLIETERWRSVLWTNLKVCVFPQLLVGSSSTCIFHKKKQSLEAAKKKRIMELQSYRHTNTFLGRSHSVRFVLHEFNAFYYCDILVAMTNVHLPHNKWYHFPQDCSLIHMSTLRCHWSDDLLLFSRCGELDMVLHTSQLCVEKIVLQWDLSNMISRDELLWWVCSDDKRFTNYQRAACKSSLLELRWKM